LQPRPEFDAHVRAFPAAEHDGITSAAGTPAEVAPSVVLAAIDGNRPSVRAWQLGVLLAPAPSRNCDVEHWVFCSVVGTVVVVGCACAVAAIRKATKKASSERMWVLIDD
jgi:hypothetical protein